MSNYLITGGAGFIGSSLAKRLLQEGHTVHVVDDFSTGFEWNIPQGAHVHRVDLCEADRLREIQSGVIDAVFHFAAQSSGEASFDNPARDILVNYSSTYHMLRWAEEHGVPRFIFASSMSVYGEVADGETAVAENRPCEPASYYGCNKLASEKMIRIFARQSRLKATILRFFNVYGPGQNMNNLKQGMVSIYFSYLMKDEPVTVKGPLDRFRDFVYIDDLIDAVVRCIDHPEASNATFNVGTGRKTTVAELLEALLAAYSKTPWDRWVISSGHTKGDIKGCYADVSRIKKAIGWEPRIPLMEGISRMKKWVDETAERWRG